jgi:cytochrome c-type biogenesis protein CcmH
VPIDDGQWLIMGSTNYLLNPVHEWLRASGILFERSGVPSLSLPLLKAVQTWEKLAQQLPPGTEDARSIEASIADARAKGGLSSKASVNTKGISGKIEIAADIKSKVRSSDIVMVIARKPGERMPVAVLRTSVLEFPMSFSLTDALAMNPSSPLSQLSEASIEVRISKTGMAMPESGDLISAPQTVKVRANNVRLVIDQVRQ